MVIDVLEEVGRLGSECVKVGMKQVGLKPEDVSNRGLWRAGILGNRLTRASVENRR